MQYKKIFITGATGTFGKAFLFKVLNQYKSVKKIVVFSRDELKQYDLQKSLNNNYLKKVSFLIGDIRDYTRTKECMTGCDLVIHAAAMKHIDICEENPFECILTNVNGTSNIVKASCENNVKKAILISTDKAVNPINLYGSSKLSSEKVFLNGFFIKGKSKTKFSVVRYGNVINSRGSVLPYFKKLINQNPSIALPITDIKMTRFLISQDQAVNFVIKIIKIMKGREIFVPKLKSVRILDIVKSLDKKYKIIGIRSSEKLHEVLISKEEYVKTIESKNYFIIKPFITKNKNSKIFEYSSDKNKFFYSVINLKKIFSENN